jgi:hypothetical protein
MVTDPATTPERPRSQVVFGLTVAGTYGLLMAFHVVFGLFFALSLASLARVTTILLAERVRVRVRDIKVADPALLQRT